MENLQVGKTRKRMMLDRNLNIRNLGILAEGLFGDEDVQYELLGVIVHIGPTFDGGSTSENILCNHCGIYIYTFILAQIKKLTRYIRFIDLQQFLNYVQVIISAG